ncbi:ATP-binding protein [Zunongwangia sp. F363]|uniref:histidine kinase n=1 Tax=Autumnicola tepida TaxID=3075595 RepID=A0ABU3CDZ6_9FLAO|nr:ATP-binding protein [Zunongwangia sp. F363]MDT0644549.1 ATP-binding protein [Zunongwangia sp. F363]
MALHVRLFTEGSISMTFKSYHTSILFRVTVITITAIALAWFIVKETYYLALLPALILLLLVYEFFRYMGKRFEVMDDFFEAVKYRDFSRNYLEENKTKDIRRLYKGFNTVNRTIREMNSEKEVQYLYLQKILEMIDIGILAYNTQSGKTLWINESFQEMLDVPGFKNINFLKSRNKHVYDLLFDNHYSEPSTIDIKIRKENLKVLISHSMFRIEESYCKLLVVHNIEDTINKTESEAWKKLLSVMTHEIMNSIAPISSLANTLKIQVQENLENPSKVLELQDFDAGLSSIGKRSEGLMKFAKTYRSLNKITHLNKEKIEIQTLFRDLEQLMKPSIDKTSVRLQFELKDNRIEVEADTYLLEQVLINLILNAIEACEEVSGAEVRVYARRKTDGKTEVAVADNGPGISQEIIDQIFIPFFTTKKQGSGIGLSLSKQIMTLHGGKIQINSLAGEGTSVVLSF